MAAPATPKDYTSLTDVTLVAWIDQQVAGADRPGAPDRVQRMREALLRPLRAVHGIGSKIISMALANLLLGTDLKRERWLTTGASLIVIDTLGHNWMHWSGILRELGAEHAHGAACYRPGGCAEIIEQVSTRINARQFNRLKQLAAAAQHFRLADRDLSFQFRVLRLSRHEQSLSGFWAALDQEVGPACVAIIGITGADDHWCVVYRVTPKTLRPLDSAAPAARFGPHEPATVSNSARSC